jgi:micrococcal nuclease
MTRALTVFALIFLLHVGAFAASPDALRAGDSGVVAAIIDADTIRLEGGKADVRLVGIQSPKLPLGRKGFVQWPLAEEARAALITLLKDRHVTLRLGTTAQDRNGRILAHVVREDGLWIQHEMLRTGWARVYTFPDNRQLAPELFAAERQARAAKRGIWADAAYAPRTAEPEALAKDIGTFQIIEGRVVSAAKVRGRVYLNFGADYRSDFTASIAPDVVPLFTRAKIDPLSFEDKLIRVRGYVRNYNGPTIDVTHPEQIETDLPLP